MQKDLLFAGMQERSNHWETEGGKKLEKATSWNAGHILEQAI